MLEQSCTFVNAYYGILDYEWLKPQYIGGTHKNTGCPKINKWVEKQVTKQKMMANKGKN